VRALGSRGPFLNWAAVWSLALATRIVAAVLLPNPDQDAYCYTETITRLSSTLAAGHIRLADLFDFWLPLFPVAAALLDLCIGNPLFAGKILSALCGAATCALVFGITVRLTRSIRFAWLAFAIVLCNPLHILYSAAAMTDLPHAALILASLWFALGKRWLIAAIFVALAGMVRTEAWALIVVLPLLQIIYERRLSPAVMSILSLPLLLCLGISKSATGNSFAFFAERVRYLHAYLDFAPSRRGFSFADVSQDMTYFLIGANLLVFLTLIVTIGLLAFRGLRSRQLPPFPLMTAVAYVGGLLGFWFFVYVTRKQPLLVPRYGLVFFALGLPFTAWLLQTIREKWRPLISRAAAALVVAFCAREAFQQCLTIDKVFDDFRAQQKIAQALASAMRGGEQRCFSDNPAVRVLSRLSADRFVRSQSTPLASQKAAAFEAYLQDRHVAYLVFMSIEDSLPVKLYPELENGDAAQSGKFREIAFAFSSYGPAIRLYRLRGANSF
jgi:hypothetical protein